MYDEGSARLASRDGPVARGAAVDAVELGEHLAGRLRARLAHSRVQVMVGDIHEVELAPATDDTVVAATCFHWLDMPRLLPRLRSALVPEGWLVVWWTVFADLEVDTSLRRRLAGILSELPRPRDAAAAPRPLRTAERVDELTASGQFEDARVETIRWSQTMDADAARALFATFSAVADLDESHRERLLAHIAGAVTDEGGVVEDPRVSVAYTVRPTSRQLRGGGGRWPSGSARGGRRAAACAARWRRGSRRS